MGLLNYEAEIKDPAEVVVELPRNGSTNRNVHLAEQLINALSDDEFDFARYEDSYRDKVRELIEAKVEGREIVAPPEEEEEAEVVNLMDALRKSIRRTQSATDGKASRLRHVKPRHRRRRAS